MVGRGDKGGVEGGVEKRSSTAGGAGGAVGVVNGARKGQEGSG